MSDYTRTNWVLNMQEFWLPDAVGELKRFLRKPNRALLYDSQTHHLKVLGSQSQDLALTSKMVTFN